MCQTLCWVLGIQWCTKQVWSLSSWELDGSEEWVTQSNSERNLWNSHEVVGTQRWSMERDVAWTGRSEKACWRRSIGWDIYQAKKKERRLLGRRNIQCNSSMAQGSLWGWKTAAAAAAAKSLQSCPTLCDPIDGSPSGCPVPGILQARTLEWVAISFSSAWKWKVKVKSLSHVWLLATPWTAAYQAPLSLGFSRQEYWSGVPLPSPDERLTEANVAGARWARGCGWDGWGHKRRVEYMGIATGWRFCFCPQSNGML